MSTWETQELPVLRALDAHFSEPGSGPVGAGRIAADTGLPEAVVVETLRVLSEAHPPYVEGVQRLQQREEEKVTGLTERALHELEQADLNEQAAAEGQPRVRRGPLPPGALGPTRV